MFDLFRRRDRAVRIVLGGILVVVSLSMLTYLIPSFSNVSNDPSDMVVAEIGKDRLTAPEVQAEIQRSMRGGQIPQSVLSSYIPQMVDELVLQRALAYEADRLGFQVTDAEVTDTIQQLIPNLFQDGKFLGKDAYAAVLAQQNLTIPEFEENLRRQMLIQRLLSVAQAGVVITNAEIEREYQRKNEKVQVEWVKLTADKYAKEVAPSPEDLQNYFKANAARYQIHEKKALTILAGDPAAIEASLNPADADLMVLYNRDKESFRVPDRLKAQRILLKTTGKPPADEPKIKAKAADLLKQIRGGASFSELVKKNSEDEASIKDAKNPGELPNWIIRAGQSVAADSNYIQTEKEFEDAAFSLKPGQVSDVVKTQVGYHIIKVLAREDAHLRTFDESKAELTAQWKKQRVNDIMQNMADKAQAALQKDPAHPEKVAAEFNMQMIHWDQYEPGQPLPLVGQVPDFDSAVGGLNPGEVSPLVALPANRVALGLVTGIVPARPATFEEVKGEVAKAVTEARTSNALQKHSQELIDAAKSSGDLSKAAKAAGLEVKTSEEFTRTGSVEGMGSASYLQDAFSRPEGTILGPITVPDGTVVAQVTRHIPADMSKLAEQRSSIQDDVRSRKARDQNALFGEGIRDALTKQGKIKLHRGVIQRLVTEYSSPS